MLVPLILALVLTLQELEIRNRSLASLLAATLAVAVVLDTAQVFGFLAIANISSTPRRNPSRPLWMQIRQHTACCWVRVATSFP